MCGIAGIVNFDGSEPSEKDLVRMMKRMRHRGPDDYGRFTENGLGLGFVRLSIIDLSEAGHQPMFSPDERYVMVYNGEIFNYIELRKELCQKGYSFQTKTDSEVLLTAYREWGEEMLPRLNGMWSCLIYDREAQTLFGARDRYGIKPFYYCLDGNRLLLASEIPSILEVMGRKPTPDEDTLFDFLVFNRTDQTEATFFREIKRMNHGHFFRLNLKNGLQEGLQPKPWYRLRDNLRAPFRNPEDFRASFSEAVGLRLRSDVPVGVCLSGGLDSSSIASILLDDYQKDELRTFSAVYGKGKTGDESDFIRLFEPRLRHMHYIYPDEKDLLNDIPTFVRAQGEPVPSTSPYAQFKVMQLASEHVTVTLDGQGADEELAGYHYFFGFYFKDLLSRGKFGRLASEMRHYHRNHRSLYGFKSLAFFMLPAALRTRARAMEKGYLDTDFFRAQRQRNSAIANELYGSGSLTESLINHFEYKLEHLLKWEDRNSMWFSLEARVPFLDHRLVEQILPAAGELIINQGMTKHILREAMKGTLPEPIRMRQDKLGFDTPQDEWFRTPLFQEYIWNLVDSPSFASRGLLDVDKVRSMYKRHLARKGHYAKEIWKWINLENWYQQFVD